MWDVVVMMNVVFNLPLGPWEGQGWFCKMKEMASEMFKSLTPSNPLFTALYELICTDMDLTDADGSPEHRQMVFDMLFAGEAYQAKGEKAAMRRWLSWIQAADQFLPKWHSVLLNLICLGQTLRVYKYRKDVPLWNNGTDGSQRHRRGGG